MELELPDCITMQNMSLNYQYHVIPAPPTSSSGRLQTETNTATRGTIRLVPHIPGRWATDQRVLWLYPRISCTAPSSQIIKVRALRSEADATATDNWQTLNIDVVATPVALKTPPKRLAPSLTWADIYFFAANRTEAGIAHSIAMFRAVGMTTIPQFGCQYYSPAEDAKIPNYYVTPEQRRRSPAWEGLQYGPQISSFYRVRSTFCGTWAAT